MEFFETFYKTDVRIVNYVGGAFLLFKETPTSLMQVFDCFDISIRPWSQKVEIKFKKYHLTPDAEALVLSDFPNNVTKENVRENGRAEPDVQPLELPFSVNSQQYELLWPLYQNIFKLALGGIGSAIPFFHDAANPEKPNLRSRKGVDFFDASGNPKHPVFINPTGIAESAAGANDGKIILVLESAHTEATYEWALHDGSENTAFDWRTNLDAEDNPLIDGLTAGDHSGLPPGTYLVVARHTTDQKISLPFKVAVPTAN